MRRKRHVALDSKAHVLDVAMILSRDRGYQKVTREEIATKAECSAALVSKYLGTMVNLRRAIMSAAIARQDLAIIAQGLTAGDSKARAAKPELKRAALERML